MRSKVAKRILDETPEEVKIFVKLYTDIVVRINELLLEKDYSQKSLADKLGKNPSEINKWLNGEHNFTLKSIAKLQAELGEILLYVPERKVMSKFKPYSVKSNFTLYRNVIQQEESKKEEEWDSNILHKKHKELFANVG